jgi:hypothetical protein
MSVGRNDPCPCGSGLKYKKCHLAADENQRPAPEPMRSSLHDLDNRFVEQVGRWAFQRFGDEFEKAGSVLGRLESEQGSLAFIVPWAVYHHEIQGMPAFEWYAREEAATLSRRERDWVDAQRRSWISLWEVRETVPGKSMIIADLLTGEKRLVQEASGSRLLVARDTFMARVVDFGDESILGGMYPRAMPPDDAAYAVLAVLDCLGRKLPIPIDTLRQFNTTLLVVAAWQSAVDAYDERRSTPPRLQNTDGDLIRLTVDHFRFAPTDRTAIEAAVGALKGACSIEESDDGTHSITFIRSGNRLHEHWENTTVGVVVTTENELRIETNSTRRGNALRKRIEKACRGLISDHHRTQTDASDLFASAHDDETPRAARELPDAEIQAVIRDEKLFYYENWLNTSIPALGGKTPKQAARSLRGREALNALLKTIENREAREPEATRYDANILRRALRIED